MSGFSDTKPQIGNQRKRLEELVDIYKIPSEWGQVRFLPDVTSYYVYWITTKTKEGEKAKAFPKICLDYNPDTEEFDKEVCPYRKGQLGRGQKIYLGQVIVRDLQQNEPRKIPKHTRKERKRQKDKQGNRVYRKEQGSGSWTPVRVVRLPSSLVMSLKNLRALNKYKGKIYDITDVEHGADVYLSHDPKIEGTQQYKVQLAEQNSLTKEELKYLRYPIHNLMEPESLEEAKEECRRIRTRLWKDKEDDTSDKSKSRDDYYSSGKKSDKKKKDKEIEVNYGDSSSEIDLESDREKKDRKSSGKSKKSQSSKKTTSKDRKSSGRKSSSKRRKSSSKGESSDPYA